MSSNGIDLNRIIFLDEFLPLELVKRLNASFDHHISASTNAKDKINFPPFQVLLVNKTSILSDRLKQNILPTFCYGSSARYGTIIHPQQSIDHGEIVIAIQLGCDAMWPWFIQRNDGQTFDYELQPGQGLLFHGCTMRYWRPLFRGTKSNYILLHYVYMAGSKVDLAFPMP